MATEPKARTVWTTNLIKLLFDSAARIAGVVEGPGRSEMLRGK